jgi:deazaflavin-dependent oxidoreductase (nitroreductase family)
MGVTRIIQEKIMPEKISPPQPPRGLSRFLFRLPIWLYRFRLGWLMGGRFLLLNHIGRKSGQPHQTVLEVVRHDKQTDTYIIASGFGEGSDWYRNLLKRPQVTIQVGSRKLAVVAERLSPPEGAAEMTDYAHRHPTAARNLARFMGYGVNGSEEDYAEVGKLVPFVALRPQ